MRREWEESLPDIADDKWRSWIRLLSATLNPVHWSRVVDETGMQFTPPPDISEESRRISKEVEQRSMLAFTPLRCRRSLDGEEELTRETLEELIQRARGMDAATAGPNADLDAVRTGLAAVTLRNEAKWLEGEPQIRQELANWVPGLVPSSGWQ